jgi:hypothetical protein
MTRGGATGNGLRETTSPEALMAISTNTFANYEKLNTG